MFSTFRKLLASLALLMLGAGIAQAQEVTIGYQLVYNPWKVAIANGDFEKATGYTINWRKFDSGAKVITAMASGDLHLALAGSSPIAAGVSRGLDVELIWIVEDIASAEALVVRDGSGINAPQDLKGKTIGVPFASTTHFHTLFALEQFGIDPVHFGVVMTLALTLGLLTPPVGMVLYALVRVTGVNFEGLVRLSVPYVLITLGVVMLLILFPQLVLFLPRTLM